MVTSIQAVLRAMPMSGMAVVSCYFLSSCTAGQKQPGQFSTSKGEWTIRHEAEQGTYRIANRSGSRTLIAKSLVQRAKLAKHHHLPLDQSIVWSDSGRHAVISEDMSTDARDDFGYLLLSFTENQPSATFLPLAPTLTGGKSEMDHHGRFPTVSALSDHDVTFSWFEASATRSLDFTKWRNQKNLGTQTADQNRRSDACSDCNESHEHTHPATP